MSKEARVSPVWYVVGLIVVGFIAWWVLKFILGLLFYIVLGALVVGAIMLFTRRGRRSVEGSDRRRIDS